MSQMPVCALARETVESKDLKRDPNGEACDLLAVAQQPAMQKQFASNSAKATA